MKKTRDYLDSPDHRREVSLEDIKAILSSEEVAKRLAEIDAREEDKRTLSGKYAPPEYVCRVCEGCVSGVRSYHDDGRIGGPPPQLYVSHWRCEGCGLRYEGLDQLKVPLKQWGT